MNTHRIAIILALLTATGATSLAQEEAKALDEVVVESKIPHVKLKNGAISFSTQSIIQGKPIYDALGLLRYIPGLSLDESGVKLAGIHSATILLNGVHTGASTSQLLAYLQTLEPRRIKSIELMLEAPSSTGVKGAAVNFVIDTNAEESGLSGMLKAIAEIGHDKSGELQGGFNHSTSKWNNHLSLSLSDHNSRSKTFTNSRHTLSDGSITPIDQETMTKVGNRSGSLQLNSSYKIDESNSLALSGYMMLSDRESLNDGRVSGPMATAPYVSAIATESKERFYHLNARYHNPAISNISLSYSHYDGSRHTIPHFVSDNTGANHISIYNSSSDQEYRSLSYNINRDSQLGSRLTASYGVYGNYDHVKNRSDVLNSTTNAIDSYAIQGKEYEHNVHAQLSYAISERMGLKLGTTLSHFYREETPLSERIRDTRLYPQLQFSSALNANNIFVGAISSKRVYPSYDELSNITLSRNAYSIYRGNPHLRPSSVYTLTGQYIFQQRHSLSLWASRTKDLKVTMPYQYHDRLHSLIQPVNLDRQNQIGLTLSTNTPVKFVPGLNLSGSLSAIYTHQKLKSFYDLSIDKRNVFLVLNARVEYKVAGIKDLYIGSDFLANTNTIQGIYKIHSMWRMDPWLSYTFWGGRATLRISWVDLFNTYKPQTLIEELRQHEEMKQWNFLRRFNFELTFRIGRKKYENKNEIPELERYMQVKSQK